MEKFFKALWILW